MTPEIMSMKMGENQELSIRGSLRKIDEFLREGLDLHGDLKKLRESPLRTQRPGVGQRALRVPSIDPDCQRIVDWVERVSAELMSGHVKDSLAAQALIADHSNKEHVLEYPSEAHRLLVSTLEALARLSFELRKYVTVPLDYDPSKATIRYGENVVDLGPGTKMRTVCEYMFKHYDFGELVDAVKVEEYLDGDVDGDLDSFKQVGNAINEINRKTNAAFGFKIFSLSGGQLRIVPPPENHATPS